MGGIVLISTQRPHFVKMQGLRLLSPFADDPRCEDPQTAKSNTDQARSSDLRGLYAVASFSSAARIVRRSAPAQHVAE